jgi:hypothetical protein
MEQDGKIVKIDKKVNSGLQTLPIIQSPLTAVEVAKINNAFRRYADKRQEFMNLQIQIQNIAIELTHESNTTQLEFENIVREKRQKEIFNKVDKGENITIDDVKPIIFPKIINQQTGELIFGIDENGIIKDIQPRGDVIGQES